MGDAEPIVKLDTEDRIATATLHRPAARNALSRAMIHALWDAGVRLAPSSPGCPDRAAGRRWTGSLTTTC